MDAVDVFSIVASVVSVILSIVAIVLSVLFYRMGEQSSKDIAESTKGIGEKLKLGLRRAWDKLRTRGQDDKNNDGREDI